MKGVKQLKNKEEIKRFLLNKFQVYSEDRAKINSFFNQVNEDSNGYFVFMSRIKRINTKVGIKTKIFSEHIVRGATSKDIRDGIQSNYKSLQENIGLHNKEINKLFLKPLSFWKFLKVWFNSKNE